MNHLTKIMNNLTRIKSNLCLAENEETREIHLALDRSKGPEISHLYMVTLERNREDEIDSSNSRYPSISIHYVIAPNGEEAIQQCQSLAFPEYKHSILAKEQSDLITASFVRVPVLIRGWGVRAF